MLCCMASESGTLGWLSKIYPEWSKGTLAILVNIDIILLTLYYVAFGSVWYSSQAKCSYGVWKRFVHHAHTLLISVSFCMYCYCDGLIMSVFMFGFLGLSILRIVLEPTPTVILCCFSCRVAITPLDAALALPILGSKFRTGEPPETCSVIIKEQSHQLFSPAVIYCVHTTVLPALRRRTTTCTSCHAVGTCRVSLLSSSDQESDRQRSNRQGCSLRQRC
jgi:hypothetical protein